MSAQSGNPELYHPWNMRSSVKIKSSPNAEITLSFVNMAKSCLSHEFLMSQICLLTQFAKIKFSRKFSNLQYWDVLNSEVPSAME